jgi:phosphoenolpyruvate---glycerone phosphotransferase subunit DhaL
MPSNLAEVERVVRIIAQTAIDNEQYFGELDAVVGDGDFGYSLARGFEKVVAEWDNLDRTDIATFLKKVALTITGRMGGTSGPIWGTGFLRAAGVVGPVSTVDGAGVVAMLRGAVEGIKARGKADVGDKTLLDALVPAVDRLDAEITAGSTAGQCIAAAAEAARKGAEDSRGLQARRGRASYTGERSIGQFDPGAVAVAVILEHITQQWTVGS